MRFGAQGLALALSAASSGAFAQGTDEFGAYGGLEERRYESEQSMAFELRIGRYRPRIDEELASAPFAQTFGDTPRYILGFEVDWQALRMRKFGSFGPGFGWGYTKFTADALLADGSGRSAQSTTLEIMPMYAVGVLRVDALAQQTPVPLAFYGKLGLGYALWWTGDGDETSTDDAGVKGRDISYGLHYAVGAMFLLDALDRASAVEIDVTTGVNNTYFFFEWTVSQLDGFGSGNHMQVGSNSWTLGLALEI